VISEDQFQRELDGTWPADLVEGIQGAAPRVISTQAAAQHLRGPSKLTLVIDVGYRRREVRMIHCVEQFYPELKLEGFTEGKISMNGKVPLRGPKTAQAVSAQISLA